MKARPRNTLAATVVQKHFMGKGFHACVINDQNGTPKLLDCFKIHKKDSGFFAESCMVFKIRDGGILRNEIRRVVREYVNGTNAGRDILWRR